MGYFSWALSTLVTRTHKHSGHRITQTHSSCLDACTYTQRDREKEKKKEERRVMKEEDRERKGKNGKREERGKWRGRESHKEGVRGERMMSV